MADDETRREQEQERERERIAKAEELRKLREAQEAMRGILGDDKKADPPDDSDRE